MPAYIDQNGQIVNPRLLGPQVRLVSPAPLLVNAGAAGQQGGEGLTLFDFFYLYFSLFYLWILASMCVYVCGFVSIMCEQIKREKQS